MRHITAVSRTPAKAGICDDLGTTNDFQVSLCFAYEIILGAMMPIIQVFLDSKFGVSDVPEEPVV